MLVTTAGGAMGTGVLKPGDGGAAVDELLWRQYQHQLQRGTAQPGGTKLPDPGTVVIHLNGRVG